MAKREFPVHPIAAKLGDTDAVKLLGYFGSTTDGIVKIYVSLDDLSLYYQIRESDILHVEEATADQLPHGGSAIWVKANAQVERCATHRASIEARFLTGEFAARMTKGPAATYRSRAPLVPETGACEGQFSLWPCSVVWGACIETAFPCVYTDARWCMQVETANSCVTCAGYTCVAECYSVVCPPTRGRFCNNVTRAFCQVFSRDVCR